MVEERLQIAVFIDFDNISIGVKSSLSRNFEIGVVLEAIKERGEVITKIAYGDWKRAEDFSRAMTQYAVQMVQRNVTPRGDKNGADINLALDALEMAFTKNHINAFVIVGGDSDFIALVEKLKQYGKKVFVVGGRAFTSIILQKNCHEFIAYENLVGIEPARRAAGKVPTVSAVARLENALPQVRRALQVLSDREVSPQLGLLKSTLLQLDPTFSERDFGASTFLEFIQKMAHAGFVNLKQVDRSWMVELKEQEVVPQQRAMPPRQAAHRSHAALPRPETHGLHADTAETPVAEQLAAPQIESPATPEPETFGPAEGEPKPERSVTPAELSSRVPEAMALVRKIFSEGRNNIHWPMYLRSFKQLLRSTEAGFDERSYGFTSVYDLVRQAQREGLLRIERNRKGILRIFPGDRVAAPVEQPVEPLPPPVEETAVAPPPEPFETAVEAAQAEPEQPQPETVVMEMPVEIAVEPSPEPERQPDEEPGTPRKARGTRTRKSAAGRQPRQKKPGATRRPRAKKASQPE